MPTFNPSKICAYAHQRLALAALRTNSSLYIRLARYIHHTDIARSLESQAAVPACRLALASLLNTYQDRQTQECGAVVHGGDR